MKPLKYLPLTLLSLTMIMAGANVAPQGVAQETKSEFPMPAAVKSGTKLRLDGSSSMAMLNESMKKSFEQKFAGTSVNLATNGTDRALDGLLKGDLDVVAIGRPLTSAEKNQGLKEQLLSREKIAIVIGKDNPFKGDITFDQFAKIFRGEIKDWSEIGGAAGPIRLVDRPEMSDTRISLSRYKVFESAPFQAGAGSTTVADDTAAMVKELGKDGIGYAITNQVTGSPDLQIVPMHKTLPTDPRYPYSQPRGYVFKQDASPEVKAFLGYAAAPAGQDAVKEALKDEAAAGGAAAPGTDVKADGLKTGGAATGNEATNGAVASSPAMANGAAATADGDGGWPWWLLPLGLLGAGGLWWLLKGRGGSGAAAVPPVDRTGSLVGAGGQRSPVAPPPTGGLPETSGTGRMNPVGVGTAVAAAGAAAATGLLGYLGRGRISLMEKPSNQALAEWEVPERVKLEARQAGGKQYNLRIADVTGVKALDRDTVSSLQDYACTETTTDRTISGLTPGRDYQAEIGFKTGKGEWMPIARSNRVTMPTVRTTPNGNLLDGSGAAVLGGAAGLGLAGLGAAGLARADVLPEAAAPRGTAPVMGNFSRVVDSQRNCYQLSGEQIDRMKRSAASMSLETGKYRIRIKEGSFAYDKRHPGEPLAMLHLKGGRFMNQQTGVNVNSTWSTLNGLDDAMIVHVYEPTMLYAFYIDTFVEDNEGEVILDVDYLI
jgi:phosphate transport system substrate-binding protein